MKQLILFFTMVLGCSVFSVSAMSADKEDIQGVWEYEAASAPYEYNEGQLIVSETDGELTLTVKFSNGGEVKGEQVKCEDNKLSFGVHLDGNFIKVNCLVDGEKLTGEVESPDGPISLTAKKKVE